MSKYSSLALMFCCFAWAPACTDEASPDGGMTGPGWVSATTTTDDGKIVIEKVKYRSGGLLVVGQVCRPAGDGPFPLIVSNHGGFAGLPAWNGGACEEAARAGYVQIEPAFRGQDGSEGFVEMCSGEVDDALRMLEIALQMPEVDPARVAMWGTSHGGCVTARALLSGAPVKVAASVFGITSMGAAYQFWQSQLTAGVGPIAQYQRLIDLANAGIGGSPDEYPEEYQSRSPIEYATQLPAGVPFLIAHGAADPLVPPRQSCELAKRLNVQGHHFDQDHQILTTIPKGCESTWTASGSPIGSWQGERYLLVYDGLASTPTNEPTSAMDTDVDAFLRAKLR
jgi:hypothetical protein